MTRPPAGLRRLAALCAATLVALLLAVVTAHTVRETSRAELNRTDDTAPHATLVPATANDHQGTAIELPPAILAPVLGLGVLGAFVLTPTARGGLHRPRADHALSRAPPVA